MQLVAVAVDDERARAEAEAQLRCDDIGVIIVDIEPGLPGALPGSFPAFRAHPLDASPVARLSPAPTTTPGMALLAV